MKTKHIVEILTGQRPIEDIWHYLVGNYRYYFYYGGDLSKKYSYIAWLRKLFIRKHIKEQIACRIEWMDRTCYNNGSCKLCGCETTNLQMADKSCDKPCYPRIMCKAEWERFKDYKPIRDNNRIWYLNSEGKLILNESRVY